MMVEVSQITSQETRTAEDGHIRSSFLHNLERFWNSDTRTRDICGNYSQEAFVTMLQHQRTVFY